MSSALKRELIFWLVAVAVCGVYFALGHKLAPVVPSEPKMEDGRVWTLDSLREHFEQVRERRETLNERNEFLREWYRWGAAVGIALVLIYTWMRPPWRISPDKAPSSPANSSESTLPVSRKALFSMIAALLVGIILLILLAEVLRGRG